jgi:hypothetical protein
MGPPIAPSPTIPTLVRACVIIAMNPIDLVVTDLSVRHEHPAAG